MEVPVLVEPITSGFRASTGTPVPLSADGPTADAAVTALRDQFTARLQAGSQLRTLTLSDVDAIQAAARDLAKNPFFDEWVQGIDEYRRATNIVPDAD